MPNSHPQLVSGAAASPEEAAAIMAAVERFMRDTAPPPLALATPGGADSQPWRRAALLEGADREPAGLTSWAENT